MRPAEPPLGTSSCQFKAQRAALDVRESLLCQTSGEQARSWSVTLADKAFGATYIKLPSHVTNIVQENPHIDIKPKRRFG